MAKKAQASGPSMRAWIAVPQPPIRLRTMVPPLRLSRLVQMLLLLLLLGIALGYLLIAWRPGSRDAAAPRAQICGRVDDDTSLQREDEGRPASANEEVRAAFEALVGPCRSAS